MILLDLAAKPAPVATGRNAWPMARRVPVESMSLTLKDRDATAVLKTYDLTGIQINSWLMDDTDPGKGIVWRVRSIEEGYGNRTHTVNLEHAINLLRDRIIWNEVTPADMINAVEKPKKTSEAKTCSALTAITYVMGGQVDWQLDTTGWEYGNVTGAYNFDGDDLYTALETISDTLEDCEWLMDCSLYPFTLKIRRKLAGEACEVRAGRNLRTITKTVDRGGMYTRIFPVGKDDLQLGNGTREQAYVEDVSRPANVATYGVIEKTETNSSLDEDTTLHDWAMNRVHYNNEPTVTISVEAFELSKATDEPMDHFVLGRLCRVPLPEYGGEIITARITEINFPDKKGQPEVCKLTLSNSQTDVTTLIAEAIKSTSSGARTATRTSKSLSEVKLIVLDTVKQVKVTGPENNIYTLKYLLVRGNKDVESDWKSGGTFSRAVWSWDVSATGNTITVTAQPQNQSKDVGVRVSDATRTGNIYTAFLQYTTEKNKEGKWKDWQNTGSIFLINAQPVYDDGWKAARASVHGQKYTVGDKQYEYFPTSAVADGNRLQYIKTAQPSSTVDEEIKAGNTWTYYVTSGDNVAYIRSETAGGSIVAQVVHNKYTTGYNAGWRAANDALVMPVEQTTNDYMDVVVPSSNPNQTASYRYTVSAGGGYLYIKNAANRVVAQAVSTEYNNGWRAANDALVMPAENTATAYMDIIVPSSNPNQTASYRYTVSAGGGYLYIKNAANTIVAQAVSTEYNDGWRAANDALVMPAENLTTDYMDVIVPSSNPNQTASYRYTVSADSSYLYIKNAVNTVVAIKAHTLYSDGWRAANDALVMPAENTAHDYMDVVVPSSNVGQTASYRYTVSADSSNLYIKNAANTVVAQKAHTLYAQGWRAANDALVMPAAQNDYDYMDVVVPSSNAGQTASYRYTVSVTKNYGYIKNAANRTVARATHTVYSDGWSDANAAIVMPSENTSTNYMDVVVPDSSAGQTGSYRYTVSISGKYANIKNAVNTVVARTSIAYDVDSVSVGTFQSSVSPSSALAGWDPQQISGVGNSQANMYRYIKFKVDGQQKSFYFA